MANLIPGLYRHYKGNLYEVVGIARHSETLEDFVVYKSLSSPEGENLWIRPSKMFSELVSVAGQNVPRFKPEPGPEADSAS
jgi:hypothetical protein